MTSAIVQLPPGYSVGGNQLKAALQRLMALGGQGVDKFDTFVKQAPMGSGARYLTGLDRNTQMLLGRETGKTLGMIPGIKPQAAMRFALKNPAAKAALRLVPGLGALGLAADTLDVVGGNESVGNKLADALAMAAAGTAGFVFGGGPIGATIAASGAKAGMDGLQRIVGADRYSEQRKLEEALAMLQRGVY